MDQALPGEVILEVASEGGALTLSRMKDASGTWRFRVNIDEASYFDILSEEDQGSLDPEHFAQSEYADSLEDALALLDRHPWFRLRPINIHPEFIKDILLEVRKRGGEEEVSRWKLLTGTPRAMDISGLLATAPRETNFSNGPQTIFSPVQEHHIDFLLEEEFTSNPIFLGWFLESVEWRAHGTWRGPDTSMFLRAHGESDCRAVRSVTTGHGETDVLVVYRSADTSGKTAILIENKIRASFQPGQAERYRKRGEEGKQKHEWDLYWTCLIAPEQYSPGNKDFDAVFSLEKLCTFFSGEDRRSRFKAGVIKRALDNFQQTGVRIKDEAMTNFRAYYAAQAEMALTGSGVKWPLARDAWWGDTWFRFTNGGIPAGSEILHKAQPGFVDLAFPKTEVAQLQQILTKSKSSGSGPKIVAKQTGKSASLRIQVDPIIDFTDLPGAEPIIRNSLKQVRNLIEFYKQNEMLFRRSD